MTESAARWYVDESAVEARVAKLIDGHLVALKIIPHVMPALARPQVGDIYLSRVSKAVSTMDGLFVDLGEGGEGFVRSREKRSEGELVVARVVQSAYGSKRTVLKPEKMDRSANKGERHAMRISKPLSADDYVLRHLKQGEALVVDYDRPWCGPEAEFSKPGLFEREGLEAQIEATLEPVTQLKGGGRLVIEQTEALTAIDVDVGSAARSSEINFEAAGEIPFQIAARGLAGNIIVDFARISDAGALAPLKERIAAKARAIGINLQIGMASRTGLLELQRTRSEPPLAALLTQARLTHCAVPRRFSMMAQAARLARGVRIASAQKAGALDLHVSGELREWLELGEGRAAWDAIRAASSAPLHLHFGMLDDTLSIETRERSAP